MYSEITPTRSTARITRSLESSGYVTTGSGAPTPTGFVSGVANRGIGGYVSGVARHSVGSYVSR
ncbi:hypothetical protein [Cryobacterium sp. CG_9.6]|uniref:hypothetical protein n=1 Tax=Cryobacterium sp. CG_9.6 TaxID=2760710 RepID=UPI002476AB42|nr:hypothetical protein [Cryobacterium sp. CG_9.6]MDH6237592.1 hypothetical protein [Cryobacterium sp. CG_9.6]